MNKSVSERKVIWDAFLKRWPLESLSQQPLTAYSTAGDKDCFVYWLEALTTDLGSMWGGSAFKFGVYSRKDQAEKESGGGSSYGAQYAWATKYGDTPEVAYAKVLAEIVKVAQAARRGDLAAVESADLGNVTKWKIAFLYQNRDAPCVLPIYKLDHLRSAIEGDKKLTGAEMHARLLADRAGRDLLEYGDEVWARVQAIEAAQLSTEAAHEFLKTSTRFSEIKTATDKMAGFRCESGREIALALDNKFPTVYLSSGPWIEDVRNELGDLVDYGADKSRSSNLAANAPSLAVGNAIVKVNIPTMAVLIKLCDAYEGLDSSDEAENPSSKGSELVSNNIPLNQILYGPPGTGKTYRTIEEALKVLDQGFFQANASDRVALKRRFDELTTAGHIRFVTFHQSFSYEDFVEGLRAVNDADGSLRYEVVNGVFKTLCESAAARVTKQAQAPVDLSGRRIWKMSLGNTNGQDAYIYDECIDQGYALLGYGEGIDFSGCKSREEVRQRFLENDHTVEENDYAVTAVATFLLRVKVGDLLVVTDGLTKFRAIGQVTSDYSCVLRSEGDGYGQRRQVKWLRVYSPSLAHEQLMNNQFSQMTIYEVKPHAISMIKLGELLETESSDKAKTPAKGGEVAGVGAPKVLIIDEINRGNVSRIFGELITLIETSKRRGESEALEVVLPYSKKPFAVPSNVYLIGTMNTTDRSLAGLDIALRRRFSFVELPPLPGLLDGINIGPINVGKMLRSINERIEILLDRDHCLGHAYFLPLDSSSALPDLAIIFRQQVLPLLQEYFFEDWERICWVLNDHRKTNKTHRFIYRPDNKIAELFGAVGDARLQDNRWVINEGAFKLAESYLGITEVLP